MWVAYLSSNKSFSGKETHSPKILAFIIWSIKFMDCMGAGVRVCSYQTAPDSPNSWLIYIYIYIYIYWVSLFFFFFFFFSFFGIPHKPYPFRVVLHPQIWWKVKVGWCREDESLSLMNGSLNSSITWQPTSLKITVECHANGSIIYMMSYDLSTLSINWSLADIGWSLLL